MSTAIAKVAPKAEPHEVGAWVESVAKDLLRTRAEVVSSVESAPLIMRPDDRPTLSASSAGLNPSDGTGTRATLTRENGIPARRRVVTPAMAAVMMAVAIGGGLAVRLGTAPPGATNGSPSDKAGTASATSAAVPADTRPAVSNAGGTDPAPPDTAGAPSTAPPPSASALSSSTRRPANPGGRGPSSQAGHPASSQQPVTTPQPPPHPHPATPPPLPDHL